MPTMNDWMRAKEYDVRYRYSRWKMGVSEEEARCYNTTDRVLLTFDDFGTAELIAETLAILKRENVRAAFFLQGDWADDNPQLVKQITDQEHWIGNHTFSHPRLIDLSDEMVAQEIQKGVAAKLLRPPFGDHDKRVRRIAADLGYKIGFWTIDSWDSRDASAEDIQKVVLPRLHKGACILLHLNTPHMLEALPALITGIRARGFELCCDGTEITVT